MTAHDPLDAYVKFSEVQIPPEKDVELWANIERFMTEEFPMSSRSRRSHRWKVTGAVSAALLLTLTGIYAGRDRLIRTPLNSVGTNTVALPAEVSQGQPRELVSKNWRVVILKSLMKDGPYYDMQLFYAGKESAWMPDLTYTWGGVRIATSPDVVQPGSLLGEIVTQRFPDGFASSPAWELSWSQNGQMYHETFIFSEAKSDLLLENFHQYSGEDANWKVIYRYEIIEGKGFRDPIGYLTLTRKGGDIGKSVSYTLTSGAGLQQGGSMNPQGNSINLPINPAQKGFDITQPQATITIEWPGGKDTLTLRKSVGP